MLEIKYIISIIHINTFPVGTAFDFFKFTICIRFPTICGKDENRKSQQKKASVRFGLRLTDDCLRTISSPKSVCPIRYNICFTGTNRCVGNHHEHTLIQLF